MHLNRFFVDYYVVHLLFFLVIVSCRYAVFDIDSIIIRSLFYWNNWTKIDFNTWTSFGRNFVIKQIIYSCVCSMSNSKLNPTDSIIARIFKFYFGFCFCFCIWTFVNKWFCFLFTGPRYRKPKQPKVKGDSEEKRPRTAFSMDQLARLKVSVIHDSFHFSELRSNEYTTEPIHMAFVTHMEVFLLFNLQQSNKLDFLSLL